MDLKELKKLINEEVNRRKSFQEQEEPTITKKIRGLLGLNKNQSNQPVEKPPATGQVSFNDDITTMLIPGIGKQNAINDPTKIRNGAHRDKVGNRPKTSREVREVIINVAKQFNANLQTIGSKSPNFIDNLRTSGTMENNFFNLIKTLTELIVRFKMNDEEIREVLLQKEQNRQLKTNMTNMFDSINIPFHKQLISAMVLDILGAYEFFKKEPQFPEQNKGHSDQKVNNDAFNKQLGLPATGVSTPTVAPPKRLKQESKIKIRVS